MPSTATIEPHDHWCRDGPACSDEILFTRGFLYAVRRWYVAVGGKRRSRSFRNRDLALAEAKKRGFEVAE